MVTSQAAGPLCSQPVSGHLLTTYSRPDTCISRKAAVTTENDLLVTGTGLYITSALRVNAAFTDP